MMDKRGTVSFSPVAPGWEGGGRGSRHPISPTPWPEWFTPRPAPGEAGLWEEVAMRSGAGAAGFAAGRGWLGALPGPGCWRGRAEFTSPGGAVYGSTLPFAGATEVRWLPPGKVT